MLHIYVTLQSGAYLPKPAARAQSIPRSVRATGFLHEKTPQTRMAPRSYRLG